METDSLKRNRTVTSKAAITFIVISLAVGVVLGAALYSKFMRTGPSQSAAPAGEQAKPGAAESPSGEVQISRESQKDVGINVEAVAQRSLPISLSATGTVTEDPERIAHIRPLARGPVEKIFVRLGDRVSRGDPLIEYDNIELGLAIGEFLSAHAELQRSITDQEVKGRILDRSKEMLRVEALARTTYDLREAEYKDAEAKTAGSRAMVAKIGEQIRRFGWTDQNLADLLVKRAAPGHNISHTIVNAPFSGVITAYHAAVGEVVEPSTELLAVTDMSSLWVLADVYEKDLSHIRPGKQVRVLVSSYPGQVFGGQITHVADVIDPKTRTAKVRCVVQNPSALLKLEMFATVEIPIEQTGSVLAVPDSSVQQIDGQPVVFVRKSETQFEKRNVQTGAASGGFTEIKSGLQAGEPVVSQGSFVVKTAFLRHLIGEKEE